MRYQFQAEHTAQDSRVTAWKASLERWMGHQTSPVFELLRKHRFPTSFAHHQGDALTGRHWYGLQVRPDTLTCATLKGRLLSHVLSFVSAAGCRDETNADRFFNESMPCQVVELAGLVYSVCSRGTHVLTQ